MEKHATETHEMTTRQGYEWIKAGSGNSYLCPIGAITDKSKATEEQLKKVCVDESGSPHND